MARPGARALAEATVLLRDWLAFDSDALFDLLEHVPIAVAVTVGPEHRYVYANALFRHLLRGFAPEIVGRTVGEVLGSRYSPERRAARDRVLETGQPVATPEVEIDPGSGAAPSYWDVTLVPITGSADRAHGILAVAVDVTAKLRARRESERKAEEARRREAEARFHEERLRLAVEATDLGLWEWDVQAGTVYWSPRQREIYGVPPDAAVDYELWARSIHPDDRERILAAVRKLQDPGSDGALHFEHRVVRPDGSVRCVAAHGRMLFAEPDERFAEPNDRRPVRLIGTVRDVTDEREADRRVAEALAAKEVLLREVNHRVKNSLQLVSAILALQSRGLPELSRREFEEARLRIQAVALVHERLYKAEDVRRVNLRAFLGALCRDLKQATVGGRAIEIVLDVPRIMAPNNQAVPLALIVNELVTNALKYAYPDGTGTIHVSVARDADALCLTVSDDGVGLAPDFEERAKKSLGMRLVRAMAQQIGGSVAHERRHRGTAFRVSFRLSDEPG